MEKEITENGRKEREQKRKKRKKKNLSQFIT